MHDEPGCELYALHEGDGAFVMVERWESPEALNVHGTAEALTTLGGQLAGKLASAAGRAPADRRPGRRPGQGRGLSERQTQDWLRSRPPLHVLA